MTENIAPTSASIGAKILLLLVILLSFVVVVLLVWPVGPAAPTWMGPFQGDLRHFTAVLAPFLVIGFVGGLIGVAELVSTFKTYPREALLTRWAWVLIFANVLAAIAALLILRATTSPMSFLMEFLIVAFGFQGIIRTRFVLAKQVGSDKDGEVAINLGWLYDQFSNLARRQIDLELMNNRRTAVTRLLHYYPTLAELYDIALYTITARETLTAEEEQQKLGELEKLIDPKAPEHFAKTSIALMILENGGQSYVNLLLDQAMNQPGTAVATAAAPPARQDTLIRRLVDGYDLEGLVTLTNQLTDDEAVQEYVQLAAQPNPATSQAEQKATIAHFLIQQIGADALSRIL
ncbi:MAG: hypothetical protein HND44_08210 [Chloroflexi bacterium]|nr:hypothetical protein [Ardenticatenaceae bacterium]MBL1128467.1 hypothetical protein [Chloroflexota bacterium]NOG34544.1 hypothetical protein [Chloroflexota bacterium]GIK56822.1 MAG: hypothetical protein BroJett015_24850 [Chloroflexota bacterium]